MSKMTESAEKGGTFPLGLKNTNIGDLFFMIIDGIASLDVLINQFKAEVSSKSDMMMDFLEHHKEIAKHTKRSKKEFNGDSETDNDSSAVNSDIDMFEEDGITELKKRRRMHEKEKRRKGSRSSTDESQHAKTKHGLDLDIRKKRKNMRRMNKNKQKLLNLYKTQMNHLNEAVEQKSMDDAENIPKQNEVVDTGPVFLDTDCRICLLALEEHETSYTMSCCGKKCHLYCINRLVWSRYEKLCPCCRKEITAETIKEVDRLIKGMKKDEAMMRKILKSKKKINLKAENG